MEIVGLSGTPRAGEDAAVVSDEKRAREICSYRLEKERETRLSRRQSFQMENMFAQMEDGEKANFKVLLKQTCRVPPRLFPILLPKSTPQRSELT